jgi:hypothetical protein
VPDFAADVVAIVERRLTELGVESSDLSGGELESRFGRREISGPASHFEVDLDGTECALTVTTLNEAQVDDYGPIRSVSDEVSRLQASGRFVAYHQVIVAPRGTVLLDLVGPEGTVADDRLQESGERLLDDLLDHASVRPLLK